jgi:hypothetical protein
MSGVAKFPKGAAKPGELGDVVQLTGLSCGQQTNRA